MAQAFLQADRERRPFVQWLRTGRLTGRRLDDGAASPEFKFNPWHDPDDGRFTHAHAGRNFGSGGGAESPPAADRGTGGSGTTPPPQPADAPRFDGPEIVVTAPRRPKGAGQRMWPVKGGGTPAVRNTIGSNGHRYAHGRLSREGPYRIDRKAPGSHGSRPARRAGRSCGGCGGWGGRQGKIRRGIKGLRRSDPTPWISSGAHQ